MKQQRTSSLIALVAATAAIVASGGIAAAKHELSAPPSPQLPRSELFTFHSDAFINLHHFLYRWGQAGPGADTSRLNPRIAVRDEDVALFATLSDEDREIWEQAARFYRGSMIGRNLLFDEDMVELRDCLVMAGNYCDRLSGTDESALELLNKAMPVYRARWWERHNGENRAWINVTLPLVRRFEAQIAPRLAAAYGGEWPSQRLRVDATVYANWAGAYTTADGHITVSTADEANQGFYGLEMVFHEASHADPLERPLHRRVERAFGAIGAEVPENLWHMTIFYTAGHLTRSAIAADPELSGTDFVPYAWANGNFERREDNRRAYAALEAHWKPALDAGGGYGEAMRKVAEAWEARGGQPSFGRDDAGFRRENRLGSERR